MEPEKNNGFSKKKSQKTVPFFQVMSCLLWEGWFSYGFLMITLRESWKIIDWQMPWYQWIPWIFSKKPATKISPVREAPWGKKIMRRKKFLHPPSWNHWKRGDQGSKWMGKITATMDFFVAAFGSQNFATKILSPHLSSWWIKTMSTHWKNYRK